jgi:hypothetical protein
MCSGKGVCEWKDGIGTCNCFDINDKTPGCFNSPVNKPRDPSSGIRQAAASLFLFIITVIVLFLI